MGIEGFDNDDLVAYALGTPLPAIRRSLIERELATNAELAAKVRFMELAGGRSIASGKSGAELPRRLNAPARRRWLTIAVAVASLAASAIGGVILRGLFVEEPAVAGLPAVSLLPIPTATLSAGGEPVTVQGPGDFEVGPDFRLMLQSPLPGYASILVFDDSKSRWYAPERRVFASRPFETDILLSPKGPGTALVVITRERVADLIREKVPDGRGFNKEQIPDLKRRVEEVLSAQEFVLTGEVRVKRRAAN